MNTPQLALTMAHKRLKIFQRAAIDAAEADWQPIDPREFWEEADDAALVVIERALAELAGQRPLFCSTEVAS